MARRFQQLFCVLLVAGTSAGTGILAYAQSPSEAMANPIAEPERPTLRVALALALAGNPSLLSWPWELRALEADSRQASRRPNPQAEALVENIATDALESTLQISQLVELGGKRARRVALARAEHAVAAWEFEAARADVITFTAQRFVEALAAQERVAIHREIARVAQESFAAVSARVRAGGASSVEETRADLALETARVELASMEREHAIACRLLAGAWGNDTPRFSAVAGNLALVTVPMPTDSLLAKIDRNPDVARWAAEISQRETTRAAARGLRVPNVTLDAGVRRLSATNETGFLIGAGIPVPIFDRGQDAVIAAERRIQSVTTRRQSARVETAVRLGIAHEEMASGLAEYRQLEDFLLPKARSAHEAAHSAYRTGLLRLTDVLDVQRAFFDVRMRTVDALVRYHTAEFEIERLTGSPVSASNTKEQE